MTSSDILIKVEKYITELFNTKTPAENVYHNLTHTKKVVDAINFIGKAENINSDDLDTVKIAGWFHDVGYFDRCEGHEEISVKSAKLYLTEEGISVEKIEQIISCIKATKMPQSPQSLMEQIICDADLHNLGLPDFEKYSAMVRKEIEARESKKFTDLEWWKSSLKFYEQHKYFTPFANKEYGLQKELNVLAIKKKIKKLKKIMKNENDDEVESSVANTSMKSKEKKGSGKGIETMFRNIVRTHVEFSAMADHKANILISVNTLVITIIVSFLIRKLDTNPQFIIPAGLLTLTSMTSLVYAILVTRPKVTTGVFSKEDIMNKKANLLFFGNFHKMTLTDFTWGMNAMMDDSAYLYDSMVKDFYHLGQVLGVKYRQLRISFTIFMYGLIISVLAFTIAFILSPAGTSIQHLIDLE